MKDKEYKSGDLIRANVDFYILQKRLKGRSWYSGYYYYVVKTVGYKWVTLKAHNKNYKMPREVWNDLIKTNRFRWEGSNV
jgi:hypothetical protein